MFTYRVTERFLIPAETVVYLSPSLAQYYARKLHARIGDNCWTVISAMTAAPNTEISFEKEPTAYLAYLEPVRENIQEIPEAEVASTAAEQAVQAQEEEVLSVSAVERCILDMVHTTGHCSAQAVEQRAPAISRRSIQRVLKRLVDAKTLVASHTVLYTLGAPSA